MAQAEKPKVVAVIPARYGSTRFPGKPLAELAGKPIIQHAATRTARARLVRRVVVATDDERIYRCVVGFGGEAVMTSPDHATGTDRIGEAIAGIECDIVVNVQGDEPAVDPGAVDAAVAPLVDDNSLVMSTLAAPIREREEILSPHVVKVVVDADGFALYFSRSPLPGDRDGTYDTGTGVPYRKHVGLYVFRRDFLDTFVSLDRTPLERAEELEQLRALENGYRIRVVDIETPCVGVDTPEDLKRLERDVKNGIITL
ncbi:MAG: 3-deoxy-manno-octulosonate cytidylyltransferase [Deltaproteobacteria bacterium]|nr:3-deoxy-manno-octulosonate cytidylyltransferase [Candidatus Zymogenaceae bacterium]